MTYREFPAMSDDMFGDEPPAPPRPGPPPDPDKPAVPPPLADRLRPKSFDEFLGQEKLLGTDGPLRRLITGDRVPSMILWGPPGSGKTTLASLIARDTESDFVPLSAVTSGIKEVRQTIDIAKVNRQYARRTILFIDEIHRFNKAQQDAFLPHVENGLITLIGATTENPSFSVIAPLLSRCRVFTLKPLAEEQVITLLRRGLESLNAMPEQAPLEAAEDALLAIARLSDGDGRRALGMLEVTADVTRTAGATVIARETVLDVLQRHLMYDRSGEEHYNTISALHKTLRSSDPHAAAYWCERMLAAGEDPRFVLRRLIRAAGEDIGLADSGAIVRAMACYQAYERLGSPEGDIFVTQLAIDLATCPKSNAVYRAHKAVRARIAETGTLPVPLHLRNAPSGLMKSEGYGKGYEYDHDAQDGFIPKQGLPDDLLGTAFYVPTRNGREAAIADRLKEWDERRAKGEGIGAEGEGIRDKGEG